MGMRDSCIMYDGALDIDRLITLELEALMGQKKANSIVKVCPDCKTEHCNEGDKCSVCEVSY